MNLIGNKLTPSDGMHLKRLSDGTVAEGIMYIPSSLSVEDFTEITHEEYLKLIQQVEDKAVDLNERISKLEEESCKYNNKITSLQEGLDMLKGLFGSFGKAIN